MNVASMPPAKRSAPVGLISSFSLGLVFGALATLNHVYTPVDGEASPLRWLLNHFTSGTWLWAVAASIVTLAFMWRDDTSGWRRYLKAVGISLVFLTATTVIWYGFVIPRAQIALLLLGAPVACLIPSVGIGVVGAYFKVPGPVGLLARLCLPLGLSTVLLFSVPPPLSYGGDAYPSHVVWWSLMGAHALMACAFLLHYMLRAGGLLPDPCLICARDVS